MNHAKVDIQTIIDLKNGDAYALAHIYAIYTDQVYQLAFMLLKDSGWSEDLVQEVYLRLWNVRDELDVNKPIWPFLYTLTKRASLNKLRSIRRSEEAFERLLTYVQHHSESADQPFLNKELAANIKACFSELPLQQERAIIMSKVEGMSYKEIAEELQISPNTVKNHIVQALKTLRNSSLSKDALHLLFIMYLLEK
ncbi:sigma-70 family RNA polymerase sigma factor [Sphingobacterium sp. DK4209]|uniref:Sigma-70 family RNA polymerase sigma factor n=1 Tax=Sphingobacterium zhuxiongii TaxID=2662364 RepID=A0A5Q0QDE8_9SPHI|nr:MULTISPECIES: sigma-70 family RNA polymerase sigma factor [unclassified Sphingobacterium]MVZ64612.1 sigma-70 family RNA polymerase sigma factor [Sphingobacterium sp. DK4209]QGA26951.1 sigma-70 family RNA polymerase sigma factor [Sphingobacterium sp. dk4302]